MFSHHNAQLALSLLVSQSLAESWTAELLQAERPPAPAQDAAEWEQRQRERPLWARLLQALPELLADDERLSTEIAEEALEHANVGTCRLLLGRSLAHGVSFVDCAQLLIWQRDPVLLAAFTELLDRQQQARRHSDR